jgi:hypothetical protein
MEYSFGKDPNHILLFGISFDTVVSTTKSLETEFSLTSRTIRVYPVPEELEFVSSAWRLAERLIDLEQCQSCVTHHLTSTSNDHKSHVSYIEPAPYKTTTEVLTALSKL